MIRSLAAVKWLLPMGRSSVAALKMKSPGLLHRAAALDNLMEQPFYCQIRWYRHMESPPLSVTTPEVLQYWHPTRNVNISPEELTVKSFKKVWWKCPKGSDHEWLSSVRYVIDETNHYKGCPFCLNKMVSVTNSLSATHPEIASEWHPTRNGALLPSDILFNSTKEVWWQCSKDSAHVWKGSVKDRAKAVGRPLGSCPFCNGSSLAVRNLAVCFPEVAAEWNYERNGKLTPEMITKSSGDVVWWRCRRGHEWKCSVNNRTSVHHSKCPYCSGTIITKDNSLLAQYPHIAAEWHPTRNGELQPSDVGKASHAVVWWQCKRVVEEIDEDERVICHECGNVWQEKVQNRVIKYNKNNVCLCPKCAQRKKKAEKREGEKTKKAMKKLVLLHALGGSHDSDYIYVNQEEVEMFTKSGKYEVCERKRRQKEKTKLEESESEELKKYLKPALKPSPLPSPGSVEEWSFCRVSSTNHNTIRRNK